MPYCVECGTKIPEGAKFCPVCGHAARLQESVIEDAPKDVQDNVQIRKQEYAGTIYKCPNCGEILNSFVTNCPACGYELREAKASNAIKEFAAKLEDIESKRWVSFFNSDKRVSKTDKQIISTIQNFAVPNTKEDMLEFMILAISNLNSDKYKDGTKSVSEKETYAAWMAKAKQVYEKAKSSCTSNSADRTYIQIKELYENYINDIREEKKKENRSFAIFFVCWIAFMIACIVAIYIVTNKEAEDDRLDAIVEEIETQLDEGQYSYALLNADRLVYQGSDNNKITEWETTREYWIKRIIEEAAQNGITLESPDSNVNTEGSINESRLGTELLYTTVSIPILDRDTVCIG